MLPHGVQLATNKRYGKNYALVDGAFSEFIATACDPLNLKKHGAQVVDLLMGLLLCLCGPEELGYEGNSANSTVNVLLVAFGTC